MNKQQEPLNIYSKDVPKYDSIGNVGVDDPLLTRNGDFITFDQVLNLIGLGRYQYKIYAILALLCLSEGAQIMTFTLMIPILNKEWQVTDTMNSLQASLIFLSFVIGSILSGLIADRYGRKWPAIASSFFNILFSFLSCFSPDIITLIVLRIFQGILVGFFGPLFATLMAEITPLIMRGRNMALMTMSISIGQLYGVIAGYLILQDLSSGNWRALIAFSTIPGCLAALACFFVLDESARFHLVNGNYEASFEILDKMNEQNGQLNFQILDEKTKKGLTEWTKKQNLLIMKEEKGSVRCLFKGNGKLITPLIWLNWFSSSFIYYGILVMMPFILEKIFISTSTEIISVLLSACVIENKHFGRKNSMIIFYALASFLSAIVYLDKYHKRFVFWVTICRVFIAMTFIFCFQFTSEFYTTRVRTTGIGMANGIGRFGGIVMPWICFALIERDMFAPFIAFSSLALISSIVSYALPYDTTGKELDSEEDKSQGHAVAAKYQS